MKSADLIAGMGWRGGGKSWLMAGITKYLIARAHKARERLRRKRRHRFAHKPKARRA